MDDPVAAKALMYSLQLVEEKPASGIVLRRGRGGAPLSVPDDTIRP
ncbi:hypothetical protein ACIPSA_48275 [Streptomyces sp. NPDC086549]